MSIRGWNSIVRKKQRTERRKEKGKRIIKQNNEITKKSKTGLQPVSKKPLLGFKERELESVQEVPRMQSETKTAHIPGTVKQ